MPDDDLIVMEDDTGTIDIPRDIAPTPPPAATAPPATTTAPAAEVPPAATPTTPPADDDLDPEKESDPRVKGILGELREKRREARAGKELARLIHARPDVLAALQSGAPLPGPTTTTAAPPAVTPAKPTEPEAPPEHELRELARDLGLWTPEGAEDVQAALRVHRRTEGIVTRTAETLIKRHIAPLSDKMLSGEAQARRTEALTALHDYGVDATLGAQVIDGLLQTNPEILADPQAAASSVIFAIGLHEIQRRGGKPAAAAVAPPVVPATTRVVTETGTRPAFVEPSSSRAPQQATMSALEERMAKRSGIKIADWVKQTERLTAHPEKSFFAMEEDE